MFAHTQRLLLFHQIRAKSVSRRDEWHKQLNACDSADAGNKTVSENVPVGTPVPKCTQAPNTDTSKTHVRHLLRLRCGILPLNADKNYMGESWDAKERFPRFPRGAKFRLE